MRCHIPSVHCFFLHYNPIIFFLLLYGYFILVLFSDEFFLPILLDSDILSTYLLTYLFYSCHFTFFFLGYKTMYIYLFLLSLNNQFSYRLFMQCISSLQEKLCSTLLLIFGTMIRKKNCLHDSRCDLMLKWCLGKVLTPLHAHELHPPPAPLCSDGRDDALTDMLRPPPPHGALQVIYTHDSD